MNSSALFERDMLYPTGNLNEPGSIHVQVLNPNSDAKIPVIIEGKTSHSPLEYIDVIVRIMQTEIFDRIFIDIKKNVNIYISNENMKIAEAEGKSFLMVIYELNGFSYKGTDNLE